MPSIIIYLVKLSVSLAFVYLFYRLVLRRLTFYNWNRFYLFCYTGLCFFIPFINITPLLERNEMVNYQMVRLIPVVGDLKNSAGGLPVQSGLQGILSGDWVLWIVAGGMIIMLLRLSVQLLSFRNIIKKARLISGKDVKLYQVDKPIIPFSFGNSIFINKALHTDDEVSEIIRHEFIHVQQKHTLDIAWAELLCLLNWYNPFVWMIRKAIRQNLEFIADEKVLESGIGKKEYQYLLLKVTGNNHFSIASQFNFSSLKKRIAMMNKMKSAKAHTLKFLFALPMAALLLLAFRSSEQDHQTSQSIQPGWPLPDTIPSEKQGIKRSDSVFDGVQLKGTVRESAGGTDDIEITNHQAIVRQKDGKKKVYNLQRASEREAFEKKYGKVFFIGVATPKAAGSTSVIAAGSGATYVTGPASATTVVSVQPALASGTTVAGTNSVGVIEDAATPAAVGTTIYPVVTADNINSDDEILFTIKKSSTAEELENFKKLMNDQSLTLTFGEMEFSPKGYLTNISGTISSKDVKGKFSASDFEKVIVAVVRNSGKTYFKINVVVKSKTVI